MKKAGFIGSGNVGQTLVRGFAANGYETTLSSRNEKKRKKLEQEIKSIKTVLKHLFYLNIYELYPY